MKIKSTLFLTLLLLVSIGKAQINVGPDVMSPLQKVEEIRYDNGTLNILTQQLAGTLKDVGKKIISRDNKGNLLMNEAYSFSTGWHVMTRDKYIPVYDGSGRVSTLWSKSFSADTNHFMVSWTYQIGYNGAGLPVYYNRADSFYDGMTLTQTVVQVDSITYNGAGKVTSVRTFTKNQTTGIYMVPANFTRWVDYDSNNNPLVMTNALTAYGDSAIMYRSKMTWDAQNRMTSFRSFPSYNYLQYDDSTYEQKSQYYTFNGNGELSLVVDSQYSGNGLQPYAIYRNFVYASGKLMARVMDASSNFYVDSSVYYRNGTGMPDSIAHYLYFGSAYTYMGRDVFTYGPNTPTSTGSLMNEKAVHVYPNPCVDVLIIESTDAGTYALIDLQGREIQTGKLTAGQNETSVMGLGSGIYFLVTKTATQYTTQKVMLK